MKLFALVAVIAAFILACRQDKPSDIYQPVLEVPDFPGSGRSGYSSAYASEAMHRLTKAQRDIKSRNLELKFRELTPPRPTSPESVAEYYSLELAEAGLRRIADETIEETKDSFMVWSSGKDIPTSRVLASCIPERDPKQNPCAVLILAWGQQKGLHSPNNQSH